MFAYLFSKELSRRGYYGTTTYGITSQYIGESTANHSVVEVETTEGPYVFDPTHGIYYTTDMATLLSCDNAETYAEGEPSMESYYLTSRFFAETSSLTVYIDARDESDLNLLRWCDGNVSSGIAIRPTATQDVVYDENLTPNSIVCTFNEEVEFYRIRIGFMEELQAPLDLTCYTVDKTGEKSVLHGNLIQDSYELNYQLDDAAIISKIIIERLSQRLHFLTYINKVTQTSSILFFSCVCLHVTGPPWKCFFLDSCNGNILRSDTGCRSNLRE